MCAACVAASRARVRRIGEALALCTALEHEARLQRSGGARPRAAALPEWERQWLHDVLCASERKLALAVLNERVAEAARETEVGAEIPQVSAKVALTAGTALALLALLSEATLQARFTAGGVAFLAGLAGALGSAQLGRIARERARQHVRAWNALVGLLSAAIPPEREARRQTP